MDSILAWNVRGLNRPNKQEDIKYFLNKQGLGITALLEIKIKKENISLVAERMFRGWSWTTNVEAHPKVCIWVAWRAQMYQLQVMHLTNQVIHCKVFNQQRQVCFYVTFVYGLNQG